ncbi:M15 family metallopeptidase [Aminivibrio sp.]|uniref:M15 family metallopeptidase n=1 Tax=Aminivibrio sp. TaxID=1872489 RepID=UPI001A596D4C|nr:M15 family metallopeptidase [Aminivibrio sp.]MBL3539408.1 M15 family metallopeptidase [Aminivibrio sp.]
MNHPYQDIPICLPDTFSWDASRRIPVEENGEPLVSAGYLPEKILASPQYYIHGVEGAIPECFVRRSVLVRLSSAADLLPQGCRLVLLDCWRPRAVQTSLFQKFRSELREKMPLLDDQEISTLASQFVAKPSVSPAHPSPHVTGGAVDLTIVDESGLCIPMGTEFDETTDRSATDYFERKLAAKERMTAAEEEALSNRRLLYAVMTRAGFTNYPDEWWHYDYGNQSWALLRGEKTAPYGAAEPPFRWKSL